MKKLVVVLLFLVLQFEFTSKAQAVETNLPYSYDILEQDIAKIHHTYKEVDVKAIGKSHFGRTIYGMKLGKGKHSIVLIGAHHGREWMTSMLLMKKLERYAKAYKNHTNFGHLSTHILDEVSIWFIPMLNPDGVTIQQNRLDKFPHDYHKQLLAMNEGIENFQRWKANGLGVDLNRQYPAGWRKLSKQPDFPSYQFYKGRKPVEAKEVKTLTQFIAEINPVIAVAYHSSGEEVFWNYHNGKHLIRDKKIAKKVSKLTGYKLAKPSKQATGGGFTDWFITHYHRPALTIEICPLVGETSPPLTLFETVWDRNKYVGLTLAEEAKRLKK
ncbi:M14 family zinc carboxypeptidase [Neobacillus sp. DY30]|uniref:M14 family zinc carboxypeptidase n=1 Tax=Neobacillus sp. DY30 TaxID=3047871 RepID=UPI0024C0930F|nr:M14 family zinc carboxypeptidase [Neobacillus sp. DY30]WHY01942.1 M14 family zinc carboxypeptidase [Neobacillus sp. DY30]